MVEPFVSVVVCTLNRKELLLRCLISLMNLNYSNMEILVIDNGSDTVSIPELNYRFRTRFFHQPIQGLSHTRNLGIHYAEGDILAFVDDDAFVESNWLRNAVTYFTDPSVACVTGRIIPVRPDGAVAPTRIDVFPNVKQRMVFEKQNFNPLTSSAGTGSNFLVTREVLRNFHFSVLLGAGTPVGGAEEELLFSRIIHGGWKILFEPEAVVYHEYPLEEILDRKRNLRNSVSRIAFLLLLLWKGGYSRLGLLKHALKRATGSPSPHESAAGGGNFHWKSLYLGPLALMNSALVAWTNRRHTLSNSSLLKEFPANLDASNSPDVREQIR